MSGGFVDGQGALRSGAVVDRLGLGRRRCERSDSIDGLGAGGMDRAEVVFRQGDVGGDLVGVGGAGRLGSRRWRVFRRGGRGPWSTRLTLLWSLPAL